MGRYDHPNALIQREVPMGGGKAGGAADTEYGNFIVYQKCRLIGVHCVIDTAGTDTDNAFTLYHGTTSIGSFALGTSTAGVTSSVDTADRAIASLDEIYVKSGTDATCKAMFTASLRVDHDATPAS